MASKSHPVHSGLPDLLCALGQESINTAFFPRSRPVTGTVLQKAQSLASWLETPRTEATPGQLTTGHFGEMGSKLAMPLSLSLHPRGAPRGKSVHPNHSVGGRAQGPGGSPQQLQVRDTGGAANTRATPAPHQGHFDPTY